MCIAPCNLNEKGLVDCRYCWQCRANRVNDLIGRCIAETHSSAGALSVTLTYGDGDIAKAAILYYPDFQGMMKRLRAAGYKVRYIVTGEYGSRKGRAHWHAILFFEGKVPDVELEKRIDWKPWGHGYAWFEKPDYKAFRYVLKYVLKDQQQQVAVGKLAMSKKPPLGHKYFEQLAERYVKQGLAPQSYKYSFDDEFTEYGARREFMMKGVTRENFLNHYMSKWDEVKQTPYPYSEILDEYTDKLVRTSPAKQWEAFITDLKNKASPFWGGDTSARVVKAVAYEGAAIIKNEFGQWIYVKRNNEGLPTWRREIHDRAQMRLAIKGEFQRPRKLAISY